MTLCHHSCFTDFISFKADPQARLMKKKLHTIPSQDAQVHMRACRARPQSHTCSFPEPPRKLCQHPPFPALRPTRDAMDSEATEAACWERLWDAEGRLKVELLLGSEPDHLMYHVALTRNKSELYHELTASINRHNHFAQEDDGRLKALKYDLFNRDFPITVYRDHVQVVNKRGNRHSSAFDRSHETRMPFFLMVYFEGLHGRCKLPLGMFVLDAWAAPENDNKITWKLRQVADVAEPLELQRPTEGPAATPRGNQAAPPLLPTESLRNGGEAPNAEVPLFDIQSRRFAHNGDEFDSVLECIHREALRRLGQMYEAEQAPVRIGRWMSDGSQVHYSPDGILIAHFGAPDAPRKVFHVEIKCGPFASLESQRCRALCKARDQHVLCVSGGYVTEHETACARPRCCVEMALYEPQGPGAEPVFHPCVVWRFPEEGPAYLSLVDSPDPQRREAARLRLLQVYRQATADALRISRAAPVLGPRRPTVAPY